MLVRLAQGKRKAAWPVSQGPPVGLEVLFQCRHEAGWGSVFWQLPTFHQVAHQLGSTVEEGATCLEQVVGRTEVVCCVLAWTALPRCVVQRAELQQVSHYPFLVRPVHDAQLLFHRGVVHQLEATHHVSYSTALGSRL